MLFRRSSGALQGRKYSKMRIIGLIMIGLITATIIVSAAVLWYVVIEVLME